MEELITIFKDHISRNPIFGEYDLNNASDDELIDFKELTTRGILVFDYCNSYITPKYDSDNNNYMEYSRYNISAFINKNDVDRFAKELSKKNYYIIVHNHRGPNYFYDTGVKKPLTRNVDFITKYNIKHDQFGNPSIENLEHICDFGSDIFSFQNVLESRPFNYLYDNFVEVSIIIKSFEECVNDHIFNINE